MGTPMQNLAELSALGDHAESMPAADDHRGGLLQRITPRQREVLKLVLVRKTSKEIAREIGVAARTVDQRLDAVRITLDAKDRFDAARKFAALVGSSERLTSEPFLLGEGRANQPVRGSEQPHYVFGDALRFPANTAWNRGVEAYPDALRRFAPGLPSASSGWRDRVAWIVIGAIAILMLVLIGLAVADSLGRLTGGG